MDERLLKAGAERHAACGCGMSLSSSGEWTWARSVRDIEASQNNSGRVLEQSYSGAGMAMKTAWRGDGYGEGLGAAQGERFLPPARPHHVKIGDEGEARKTA